MSFFDCSIRQVTQIADKKAKHRRWLPWASVQTFAQLRPAKQAETFDIDRKRIYNLLDSNVSWIALSKINSLQRDSFFSRRKKSIERDLHNEKPDVGRVSVLVSC